MSDTTIEFSRRHIGKTLNYKGMQFKVMLVKNVFYVVVNFDRGREWAGTRAKTFEECLIRFTSILNQTFIQGAITHPRVGDLFDVGSSDEDGQPLQDIIIEVKGNKLKLIPLKEAKVYRHCAIKDDSVHPYLQVTNQVEGLLNELSIEYPKYIILEDGVLHTNNYPVDVFVWKAKLDEK